MKLYTFFEGQIHSLEVKETPLQYATKEPTAAFGWKKGFHKQTYFPNYYSTTRIEAIEKAIRKAEKKLVLAETQTSEAQKDIAVLADLKLNETKNPHSS